MRFPLAGIRAMGVVLACQAMACGAEMADPMMNRASAPPALEEAIAKSGLEKEVVWDVTSLNPFYLRGDFDGDGSVDYVVRCAKKNSEAVRLAVLHGHGKVSWLDKDKSLDYPSVLAWYVVSKQEAKAIGVSKLVGDGIMIVKPESSSSLVYWNGKRFVSSWQGD
ncbi:MAG: hypothetical protein HP492_12045 [Nitrospira sp.]|nr:hypothetical protein [Nitrospira sp.]